MDKNNLQRTWKEIEGNPSDLSKKELDKILSVKVRNAVKREISYFLFSGVVAVVFIIFLVLTAMNRSGDPLYLLLNSVLGVYTLFALFSSYRSFRYMQPRATNQPVKIWLQERSIALTKWGNSRVVYYLAPIIAILVMVSIHVYFERKPLTAVFSSGESVYGLAAGFLASLGVTLYSVRQLKKRHLASRDRLDNIYRSLDETA